MERMGDSRTAKRIGGRGTEGKRKPERPRKEWRRTVWEDIRRRNITNWGEDGKEKIDGRKKQNHKTRQWPQMAWKKPYNK